MSSSIRWHGALAEVDRNDWNVLVGDGSPFLEWDFLQSLEQAGCVGPRTGWIPTHLTIHDDGRLVAGAPLYVKTDSHGEFVFDWTWAEVSHRLGLCYYPKLVAAVPFTPVAGGRLLVAAGESRPARVRELLGAIGDLCSAEGLSSLHVLFAEPGEVQELAELGFMVRPSVRHRWRNDGYSSFADFLSRFPSKRRAQIRHESAHLTKAGVTLEVLTGASIPDRYGPTMEHFYARTVDKYPWGHRHLNRSFFQALVDRFRERLNLVVACKDGREIGMSINICKDRGLYGRYWGGEEGFAFLHFNVCYYRPIEWCIDRGIQMFDPGAGGEHKAPRGFVAEPQDSLHQVFSPMLDEVLRRHLEREDALATPQIAWMRAHSPFKKT